MKRTLLFLGFSALLFSCQKEPDVQLGDQPGGTQNGDYQPTTANSVWRMKSTGIGDYTIRSLGTDSTVNGEKFYRFDHSIGGRQYVSKKDGTYKQLVNDGRLGGWASFVYLKDAAVGTSWTETLGPAQMVYSVGGRNMQRTVNGKPYKNVLLIKYEQYAMGLKTASGEQYYAKGVGGIEGVSWIELFGVKQTVDSSYLVSADIK